MLKVKASDDGFEWFSFLINTYAEYKNNHIFYDITKLPTLELTVEIKALEELIKEYIDVGEL